MSSPDLVSSVDRPHRRRSARSRTKSPSVTKSTTNTNITASSSSPTPTRVVFTAKTSLSPEPSAKGTGVQNITRKVIKTLEGFVHLDILEMNEEENDSEREKEEHERDTGKEEEREVAKELLLANGNGVANGVNKPKKIDWEIPRKVLHSSIGFFTIYLYLSRGSAKAVVYVLWTALAIIAPADYLRLTSPSFARVYERWLGFLMRESEKKSTNGVIWYIIGVNFALTFYPLDIATVAILILSWADTAASTIGRLWGSYTPRLPSRTPVLRLPLAPRKSLAGFIAACVTGACIAVGFWTLLAPIPRRVEGGDVTWFWDGGVRPTGVDSPAFGGFGGWLGLSLLAVFAGLVSGVAEALDLGSWDDNLTLPIISGGCLLGFFKLLGAVSSWLS